MKILIIIINILPGEPILGLLLLGALGRAVGHREDGALRRELFTVGGHHFLLLLTLVCTISISISVCRVIYFLKK